MGIGRGNVLWLFAGFMSSFPIPFIYARQMKILYQNIPSDIQGRNFFIRNAIQFSTIPIGILAGVF